MVQIFEASHTFNSDFQTVSLAYFNRYPNPYAGHVLSVDTLECYVDEMNCLRTTKLIIKTGRLPSFIKPLLGDRLNSCIIEKTFVNPKTNTMLSYSANVDHRKFIKVEEFLKYTGESNTTTLLESKVKFSSNLFGFKQKIEEWSHRRFSSNISNSREGLKFVVEKLKRSKDLLLAGST